jgi:c-di-GMP-binding flagellar brake protein YcgR
MADSVQRRQYVRTAVSLPVSFTVEGDGARLTGDVVDLGEGGMRLACGKHLAARTGLRLSFALPDGRQIGARGRVVLSYYAAGDQKYHHGVAFTSIDPEDQAAIGRFVSAHAGRA